MSPSVILLMWPLRTASQRYPRFPRTEEKEELKFVSFFFALLLRMRRENRTPTPYLHHHSPFLSQIDRGLLPML